MNVINTGNREGARHGSHREPPAGQTPVQTPAQRRDALLLAIRAQCVDHLLSSVRTLFDKADDLLFDLARRSEKYLVKREYFEAMQEIHRQRTCMEDYCKSEFLAAFNQCRPHTVSTPVPSLPTRPPSDSTDDDFTREQLAIAFLIENAERASQEDLLALNPRIGILLGNPELTTAENPAGPAVVGAAIKAVMSQMRVGGFIRLLVFALFDRHVMGRLQTLYRALNEFLINQQVLPEILTPVQKPGPMTNVPVSDASAAAPSIQVPVVGDGLPWLLTNTGTGIPPPPAVVNMKVVRALTSLQRGGYVPPSGKDGSVTFNVVRDIKTRSLLPQMDQADDARFDLMAMLFDYFLNDERLPVVLRERIARLQIPFIKTAFIDHNFFIIKTHPARRLLNTITQLDIENMGDFSFQASLLDLVDQTVQRIQDEFEEDMGLYAALQVQLEQGIASARQKITTRTGGTAYAPQNQSRHEDAKQKIRALIDTRLDHAPSDVPAAPEIVRNFILTHWQRLLIKIFLEGGENNALLNDTIHTMDDLIWSTAPKRDAAERDRLRRLQPDLFRRLEIGMERLTLPSFTRAGFMDKLAKCHAKVMGSASDQNTGSETISEDDSLAIAAALFEEAPHTEGKKLDSEEITTPREIFLKTARVDVRPSDAAFSATKETKPQGAAPAMGKSR